MCVTLLQVLSDSPDAVEDEEELYERHSRRGGCRPSERQGPDGRASSGRESHEVSGLFALAALLAGGNT